MSTAEKYKLPKAVLVELTRRSDVKGLLQLSGHLFAMLLAGLAFEMSQGLLGVAALLLYGALLTFLFAPLHETIHFTAFKSAWLNNAVAAFCGFLLFLPYRYFRAYHYAHHRHTQNPEKDPELLYREALTRRNYLYQISGSGYWISGFKNLWEHACGIVSDEFIDVSKHAVIILEARIHLAIYLVLLLLSLILSNAFLWWYWILPAILTQPLLRLFLIAEHSGCDQSDNMLENSRTTYTTPLIGFISWNMCYHAEHHFLASVPFHALPALHAYTGQQVKYRGDGYYQVNREIASQI
ncbi:MAG: fatty acid desaturase [Pseudomonadota bacterium]